VYGFIRGLLAVDWLFEQDHRLYLGPAFYGLAIASGHIRAGLVSPADLDALHRDSGLSAFVGIRAGDSLIYIAEAGSDMMSSFQARSNIRRRLLTSAGGKVVLASLPETELDAFLRARKPDERQDVEAFLEMLPSIRESEIALNISEAGSRTGVATIVRAGSGQPVASVTLVGPSAQVLPRLDSLSALLKQRVEEWRDASSATPRELI